MLPNDLLLALSEFLDTCTRYNLKKSDAYPHINRILSDAECFMRCDKPDANFRTLQDGGLHPFLLNTFFDPEIEFCTATKNSAMQLLTKSACEIVDIYTKSEASYYIREFNTRSWIQMSGPQNKSLWENRQKEMEFTLRSYKFRDLIPTPTHAEFRRYLQKEHEIFPFRKWEKERLCSISLVRTMK